MHASVDFLLPGAKCGIEVVMRYIGKLDHRIDIEGYTETFDAFNAPIQTYSVLATVSAQRIEGSGSEIVENNQVTGKANIKWRIRYLSGVTLKHRVKYDSRYFNIQRIEVIGRKEGLMLHTEESI